MAIARQGLKTVKRREVGHKNHPKQWMPWMEKNLKFSQQQASRYMRAFDRKDSLKLLSESNFGGWERALIEHKPKPKQEVEEDERIDCH